jgi:probable rRNA maturation factor
MPESDDHPPAFSRLSGVDTVLSITDGTGRLPRAAMAGLEREAGQMSRHLGVGGECRVRIAGDHEVAAAHLKHLGVPGTTDVITFDLSDPNKADAHLFLDVDLLVCLDEAERQARLGGVPVERELLLYIVHGVLHCLGHDDHDEDDAEAMHAREDEILTAIGVGPVYRRAAGTAGGAVA